MRMVVAPVTFSPLATAHWIGAAPRYLGSNEACRLRLPHRGRFSIHSGIMRPYATTMMASGWIASRRARKSGLFLIFSGCTTGRPACPARILTGGADGSWSRPRTRSGWVTTNSIVWPAASNCCRVGMANCGVPQKTSLIARLPFPRTLQLADLAQDEIALESADAEDEEYPVEMVDFMLEGASQQVVGVTFKPVAL